TPSSISKQASPDQFENADAPHPRLQDLMLVFAVLASRGMSRSLNMLKPVTLTFARPSSVGAIDSCQTHHCLPQPPSHEDDHTHTHAELNSAASRTQLPALCILHGWITIE
ncbi:hypothetical protein AC578_10897, partial [Pseudocercospora eumusae]